MSAWHGSRLDTTEFFAKDRGSPELSVVMPVYNEAPLLRETIEAWVESLRSLRIPFRFFVYDDGSTDGSGELLEAFSAQWTEIRLTRQANRGHGPTIRRGYAEAVGRWVFQTDSDLEVNPDQVPLLWNVREDFDLLVGRRLRRDLGVLRSGVSALGRTLIRRLFASGAHDVNSPFRLIRRSFLDDCLERIPHGTFAPNPILTGIALAERWRYREVDVFWQPRRHGSGLRLRPRTLVRFLRATRETIAVAGTMKKS